MILIIIGEGENREKLEKKIKEKDLEDKIKLIGFKNNMVILSNV